MYICVCRGVTDQDIKKAAQQGANSLESLSETLGVGTHCGICQAHACQVLAKVAVTADP